MSDTALIDTPASFTERAVHLLQEYLRKFREVQDRMRMLRMEYDLTKNNAWKKEALKTEFAALEMYFERLQPAVKQFSQQVSGMIDQGRVTPISRVELQLRLAELEVAVIETPFLLNTYRPK